MTELICVDPARAREFWPHVAPLLRQAVLNTNLCHFDDIEQQTLHGGGLLWLAWSGRIEAAATTIVIRTEAGSVCILSACGGKNRERWFPLLKKIEAYAKNNGCMALRIYGRKGWQRVLDGYDVTNVVLERQL